ncbi:MAG TPA: VanZ family protein [Steroidobacteraceae bacterium]
MRMKLWWGLGALGVGLAVYVCLVPTQELPQAFDLNDKLNHLLGHAVLAVYFSGLVARRSWWKLFVFLLLLGVAIEIAQHCMHVGRLGDFRDVIANLLGAAFGLLLGHFGLSRWPQWANRLVGQKASP